MLTLLLLITLSTALQVCRFSKEAYESIGECPDIIELDNNYIQTCFILTQTYSFQLSQIKDENSNVIGYTMNIFGDAGCSNPDSDYDVAYRDTGDIPNVVVKATLKVYEAPVVPPEPIALKKETITATEYIKGDVCFGAKKYVSAQYGVSVHKYIEKCGGDSYIGEIITTTFNGNEATTTKITLKEGAEFTLDSGGIKTVIEVPTSYPTFPEVVQLVEMNSPTQGKLYDCSKEGCILANPAQVVTEIPVENRIAKADVCSNDDCTEIDGTAYVFHSCVANKSYSIIGDLFAQVTFGDEGCVHPLEEELVVTTKSILEVGNVKYKLTYTPIESNGTVYGAASNIQCYTFRLGKCLKVSDSISQIILKDSENKYVYANFLDGACSAGMALVYLDNIVSELPIKDANITVITTDNTCENKEVENSIAVGHFVLDTCNGKEKYVMKNGNVTKYTFESEANCNSDTNGVFEIDDSVKCNACSTGSYVICPKEEETDSSSSAISFLIASLSIIAFLIF